MSNAAMEGFNNKVRCAILPHSDKTCRHHLRIAGTLCANLLLLEFNSTVSFVQRVDIALSLSRATF